MDLYTITTHEALDRIARNCPRALSTYVHVLCRADDSGKAKFSRVQITNNMSESFAKFRNDLRALARESFLEWHQMGQIIHVTLALPETNHDGT